jgi:hypothetical protein
VKLKYQEIGVRNLVHTPIHPSISSRGVFRNSVDRGFIGFPPIPQKEAEWMGHEGL